MPAQRSPAEPAQKVEGPASYFPSIEKTYGKPVDEWLDLVRARVTTGTWTSSAG